MPRHARIESSSNIYHVIIRAINQQDLFLEDSDYIKYLSILNQRHEKYSFIIYSYCIMNNHIHLLVQTDFTTLSSLFKSIGVSFVSWYNKKYHRYGHLFQDRYKSVPVENETSFLRVINYIHLNPVKAGMVEFTTHYQWSSCRAYYGSSDPLYINNKPANQ